MGSKTARCTVRCRIERTVVDVASSVDDPVLSVSEAATYLGISAGGWIRSADKPGLVLLPATRQKYCELRDLFFRYPGGTKRYARLSDLDAWSDRWLRWLTTYEVSSYLGVSHRTVSNQFSAVKRAPKYNDLVARFQRIGHRYCIRLGDFKDWLDKWGLVKN